MSPISQRAGTVCLLTAALICGCAKNEPGAAPAAGSPKGAPAAAAAPAASKEPVATVKAEELAKEFAAGQAAAEKKYKDKYVAVEGIVEAAPSAGAPDKMSLASPQAPDKGIINCDMSPEAQKTFRELGRGQKVKVVGKEYLAIAGNVYLNDCTYKEEGPNPAVRISAKDLGAEFLKDETAAAKKYESADLFHPKEMIVEGVVKEVGQSTSPEFTGQVIQLESGMKEPMACGVARTDEGDVKSIKKGDTVVLKGGFRAAMHDQKRYPSLQNAIVLKKP